MIDVSFYELKEPTRWAEPPTLFSFSSLQSIRQCPKRWQMINSEWGTHKKFPERPQPSAIEGQIVHEALDKLARALGKCGRPPIGSPAFQACVENCGFWDFFAKQIDDWNTRLTNQSQAGYRYILQTKPRDLANQAIRLFREQYQPKPNLASNEVPLPILLTKAASEMEQSLLSLLNEKGALSELRLEHPSLPVMGIIDLIILDDTGFTTIVDFKTGMRKTSHEEQLYLYAVLWWRATNNLPTKIVVQYLDAYWEILLKEDALLAAEENVSNEIHQAVEILKQQPASAKTSQDCLYCPIRPRCEEGWAFCQKQISHGLVKRQIDLEVTVASSPTPTGFLGTCPNGKTVSIVYTNAVALGLPKLKMGESFRLVDATTSGNGEEIEVLSWTKMYCL